MFVTVYGATNSPLSCRGVICVLKAAFCPVSHSSARNLFYDCERQLFYMNGRLGL